MIDYFQQLISDVRYIEALNACVNCGTCTAICPAASFYNYEPRTLLQLVQRKDNKSIEELLQSDYIWYCGECMSCKTRCPRGNVPGLLIMALRALSIKTGTFVKSEKGRQLLAIKRTIGDWIVNTGYCLYLKGVGTENHPELGTVWDWLQQNYDEVMHKLGANVDGLGPGILRKIPDTALKELQAIFEVTGGIGQFDAIEKYSKDQAEKNGFSMNDNSPDSYINHILKTNSGKHNRQ